jgi:hypothetical protein
VTVKIDTTKAGQTVCLKAAIVCMRSRVFRDRLALVTDDVGLTVRAVAAHFAK